MKVDVKALKNNTGVTIEKFQREMLACKSLFPALKKNLFFYL